MQEDRQLRHEPRNEVLQRRPGSSQVHAGQSDLQAPQYDRPWAQQYHQLGHNEQHPRPFWQQEIHIPANPGFSTSQPINYADGPYSIRPVMNPLNGTLRPMNNLALNQSHSEASNFGSQLPPGWTDHDLNYPRFSNQILPPTSSCAVAYGSGFEVPNALDQNTALGSNPQWHSHPYHVPRGRLLQSDSHGNLLKSGHHGYNTLPGHLPDRTAKPIVSSKEAFISEKPHRISVTCPPGLNKSLNSWGCVRCGFRNYVRYQKCLACPYPDDGAIGEWCCTDCNWPNAKARDDCQRCGTLRMQFFGPYGTRFSYSRDPQSVLVPDHIAKQRGYVSPELQDQPVGSPSRDLFPRSSSARSVHSMRERSQNASIGESAAKPSRRSSSGRRRRNTRRQERASKKRHSFPPDYSPCDTTASRQSTPNHDDALSEIEAVNYPGIAEQLPSTQVGYRIFQNSAEKPYNQTYRIPSRSQDARIAGFSDQGEERRARSLSFENEFTEGEKNLLVRVMHEEALAKRPDSKLFENTDINVLRAMLLLVLAEKGLCESPNGRSFGNLSKKTPDRPFDDYGKRNGEVGAPESSDLPGCTSGSPTNQQNDVKSKPIWVQKANANESWASLSDSQLKQVSSATNLKELVPLLTDEEIKKIFEAWYLKKKEESRRSSLDRPKTLTHDHNPSSHHWQTLEGRTDKEILELAIASFRPSWKRELMVHRGFASLAHGHRRWGPSSQRNSRNDDEHEAQPHATSTQEAERCTVQRPLPREDELAALWKDESDTEKRRISEESKSQTSQTSCEDHNAEVNITQNSAPRNKPSGEPMGQEAGLRARTSTPGTVAELAIDKSSNRDHSISPAGKLLGTDRKEQAVKSLPLDLDHTVHQKEEDESEVASLGSNEPKPPTPLPLPATGSRRPIETENKAQVTNARPGLSRTLPVRGRGQFALQRALDSHPPARSRGRFALQRPFASHLPNTQGMPQNMHRRQGDDLTNRKTGHFDTNKESTPKGTESHGDPSSSSTPNAGGQSHLAARGPGSYEEEYPSLETMARAPKPSKTSIRRRGHTEG
ncbi:MAG: hypothetical protein LQ340_004597 [Diploschistes diacapsis]|nr:MAG: hypothetical protein LQ340_004597 [Diploschistes diacapsis]